MKNAKCFLGAACLMLCGAFCAGLLLSASTEEAAVVNEESVIAHIVDETVIEMDDVPQIVSTQTLA